MTKRSPTRIKAKNEIPEFQAELMQVTGDMSGKLNDLADTAIRLARMTKDPNERTRLRVLAEQIERADKAILDVGIGIL